MRIATALLFWGVNYHGLIEGRKKYYFINTGSPLITRPPIARISLQHGFSKIWTPLVTLGVLPAARFLQYIFIDFYNIFMKLTIPPIARISHSTDFSCSQKTVLWEDLLYLEMKQKKNFTTHILIFINMIITFNFLALTLTF